MASPLLLLLTFISLALLISAFAPEYVKTFVESYQSARNILIPAVILIVAWILLSTQSFGAIFLAGFMVVVLVLGLYYEHGDVLPF